MQHMQMEVENAFENMFRMINIFKLLHGGHQLNFQYLLHSRKIEYKIL